MPRNDPTAAALEELASLRHSPQSQQTVELVQSALRHRSNFVVASAARLAGELRMVTLVPDLTAAFERLMPNAPKLDKGCAALTEIVSALYELDYTEPGIYLSSIRHMQMEGSFGPPVDVAAKLRGTAALALVRTRHPQAFAEIVDLLVDKEVPARLGAIRALATNAGDTGALLLRLKALTGDDEPEALVECFAGLLALGAGDAVSFVGRYADSKNAAESEAAIMALGASRLPQALDALKQKWDRTIHGPVRKMILTALASNRSDAAADFLLSLLSSVNGSTAKDVVIALAGYRSNQRIRSATEDILRSRDDKTLLEVFRSEF